MEAPSLDAWRQQLGSRGHVIIESNESTGFQLWPSPDSIITVGIEPDGTLRAQYRQRYFVCAPEPEQLFRLFGCPEPHSSRWLEILSRQPEGYWYDFLAGPGAWTLTRLAQFPGVIAWSERGLEWSALDSDGHRKWGMDVPARAAPFFSGSRGPEACRPHYFSSDDEQFADVVAACCLFASVGTRDCYLADEQGAEVYLAHHHDMVVVSIPDKATRKALVQEVTEAAWLFEDVSGYASTMDDD